MTHLATARSHRTTAYILIGILWLAAACAEIGPPPGGEVDRSGPVLMASYPAVGALNVPEGDEIVLEFSENIVKPTNTAPVFISPRPAEEPKVRFAGRRIEIQLADFFLPNQTYIVSVSSEVADLRRNKLAVPVAIAFSTGAQLDSGVIGGLIEDNGRAAGNVVVGLYRGMELADSIVYDSIYPDYLATTGTDGRFELRFLPPGDYRLIGFRDKNRDERFSPLRERFALPDRAIQVGGSLPLDSLRLAMTSQDTLRSGLLSVRGASNGVLKLRLSKPVNPTELRNRPGALTLTPLTDTAATLQATGILASSDDQADKLTVAFGPLQAGAYRLTLRNVDDASPIVWDSLLIDDADDEVPPVVLSVEPGRTAVFASEARPEIVFSEPMDAGSVTPQTFSVWSSGDAQLPLTVTWPDPFRARLQVDGLEAGESYRLVTAEFDLKDLAGLQVGDSLTEYSFSTLSEDSLGAVEGTLRVNLPDRGSDPVILTFKATSGGAQYEIAVPRLARRYDDATPIPPRTFRDDLPAGKYLISGFVDSDDNGTRSLGSIDPYSLSETYFESADTVIVRARFETAGLELDVK